MEIVELLLSSGVNIESKTNSGFTALIKGSLYGHLDIVKLLVDKKADIDAVSKAGFTALMAASQVRL